jgi:hypothetical protein
LRGANNGADSNPARVKARGEVQNFILHTYNMQVDVRNDVKQSVGLVVTSELLCVSCLCSIPRSGEAWSFCPSTSPSVGSPKRCFLFHLFYHVYLDSEKHVTRTSKPPYSRRAVNRIQAMVPLTAPLFGVIFLRGYISVKNRTYCPLLRESATPFKSTCLLTTLK